MPLKKNPNQTQLNSIDNFKIPYTDLKPKINKFYTE